MNKAVLEKLAIGVGATILIVALGFWALQVKSVIELLQMAYG
jgi:hypothetical protein